MATVDMARLSELAASLPASKPHELIEAQRFLARHGIPDTQVVSLQFLVIVLLLLNLLFFTGWFFTGWFSCLFDALLCCSSFSIPLRFSATFTVAHLLFFAVVKVVILHCSVSKCSRYCSLQG